MVHSAKKTIRKIVLCLLLCSLCMSPVLAFGATDTTGMPIEGSSGISDQPDRMVMAIIGSFVKISNVQAYAHVYATSSSSSATILSAIELQARDSVDDDFATILGPAYRRFWNTSSIEHEVYFPISSDKQYRIKVTITDTVEGVENTETEYFDLVESASD